jgi:septum formation topological specificity factor MinE
MLTLPITRQSKQQERQTILTTDRNNGFPTHIIHNLKKKLKAIIQQQQQQQQQQISPNPTDQHNRKWTVFTYHLPLIRKVTNLFKRTNLIIALRATNTTYKQLTEKPAQNNSSGIYEL